MRKRISALLLATAATLTACGTELELEDHGDVAAAGAFDAPGEEQSLTRRCKPSTTVKGIDVSYWQSQIDWNQVARDGVKYAFIRVSDGSTFIDPRFQENWAGARAAGVKRGVYQFFRSNRDPIEQANILLDQMGPLQPGDLPPVIDVESTDGQSSATVARKVSQWIDHVEARLGVKPIIYTGPYFWRDSVKSDAFADHPLWIAHYGTDCPLTPPPWSMWSFHQFTDRGRVAGIRAQVDTNHFAGTMADLEALSYQGDGRVPPPPPSSSCASIPANGGVVDEDSTCFTAGGPVQYLHAETSEGHGGGLLWTMATASASRENYGEWELRLDVPGRYRLQAFTDMSVATSQFARYRIEHDGVVETKQLDQRSLDGFRDLGTFTFASGTARVVLNDNTGEAASQRKKLVFDALQVLPADDGAPPPAPGCSRVRVQNADALNIRPTASTSRAAIGSLRRGDVVERQDSVDGESVSGNRTWHKVTRGGVTGFVTSYYTACVD